MRIRSQKEWLELISEFESSNMSQTDWCKLKKINLNTFRSKIYEIERKERFLLNAEHKKEVEEVKWASISTEIEEVVENSNIKIYIGKFAINIGEDFNEESLLKICKVLVMLC